MAWFVCLEQLPARPLIDFFIRFRSDVWPGQRDGRRLFRHAVPGCFPDLKGVLWLGFCAWNSGSAGQTLDFFIRFRSDVWPGHRGGRRLFRHAVPGCFPCFVCLEQLPARPLIFSFGSGVTFGRRRLFRHAVPGCFPDSKGVLWLGLCAWNNLIFSFGSGVTFGPGRGTAGGCFVTPCQGVFLI